MICNKKNAKYRINYVNKYAESLKIMQKHMENKKNKRKMIILGNNANFTKKNAKM